MNLNKGISTPIVILLIIVFFAITGLIVWQFTTPEETPNPTAKQPSDYTTQANCESANYYWYDDACYEEQKSEDTLPSVEIPSGAKKIGETEKFLIYKKPTDGATFYRIFKMNNQTGQEVELESLNYSHETNASFHLSPNGKYLAQASFSGKSGSIKLLSLEKESDFTILAETDSETLIEMKWAEDSSKIAYWTTNRGESSSPPYKVYLIDLNETPIEPMLLKTYNDMTSQGAIVLQTVTSSELQLKRAKITNGAPPEWIEETIAF